MNRMLGSHIMLSSQCSAFLLLCSGHEWVSGVLCHGDEAMVYCATKSHYF